MAIDQEFFDAADICVVKKKYYNANKVNALLEVIQRQTDAANNENAFLRSQLEALGGQKNEIGKSLISAQETSRKIVDDANEKAAAIVADAEKEAEAIISRAKAQARLISLGASDGNGEPSFEVQEKAVRWVEKCIDTLKKQQLEAVETLNSNWQQFLCSLEIDDEAKSDGTEYTPEDEADEIFEDDVCLSPDVSPCETEHTDPKRPSGADVAELENKVNAIARELMELLNS